ncbi:hypothetical protein AAVH_41059 [Aphelenchoides avenae]|nr:hypothetical protein AAVH_41059 [Aphelenchus avenae]
MSINRHDDDISVPQPVPVDQAYCPWCNQLMLANDIAPHQRAYALCFIDVPNRAKKFGFFVCKDETFESITERLLNQRLFAGITRLT